MNNPRLLHVCVAERKGIPKQAVPSARLRDGHGIENDAHAGPWHRQISILDAADIDTMRARGLNLRPGAFGENLVLEGLPLEHLGIGTRLTVGDCELEITQIGKLCHQRCAIYYRAGDCIMPRAGLFARVVRGGEVHPGDTVRITRLVPRERLQASVLTVSDRASAGIMPDTAGPAVADLLATRLDAHIAQTAIVPDEVSEIVAALRGMLERNVDLIVTVGGTGCAPRDVTPEATRAVITREVPGLAEAMRQHSARHVPYALLQRGICGIAETTLIINVPGNPKAAVENLEVILHVLRHARRLLRGNTEHHAPAASPPASGSAVHPAGHPLPLVPPPVQTPDAPGGADTPDTSSPTSARNSEPSAVFSAGADTPNKRSHAAPENSGSSAAPAAGAAIPAKSSHTPPASRSATAPAGNTETDRPHSPPAVESHGAPNLSAAGTARPCCDSDGGLTASGNTASGNTETVVGNTEVDPANAPPCCPD